MRQRGTISGWKDDKGFGFVTPLAGGEEAFVHINAFFNRERRPVDGDEISYDAVQDFQKRWQAKAIRYADEPAPMAAAAEPEKLAVAQQTSHFSALPLLRILLVLLVLAILGLVAQQIWARSQPGPEPAQALFDPLPAVPAPAAAAQVEQAVVPPLAAPVPTAQPTALSHMPIPGAEVASRSSLPLGNSEPSRFTCDGRTRCTQMHSCAEATWFITNCPHTQMDGDDDGVPCESQWCEG